MSNILDDYIEETFQNKLDSIEVIRRNMEVGYQKMMQFRIKSITLLRHFVLGNIHLDLWHENGIYLKFTKDMLKKHHIKLTNDDVRRILHGFYTNPNDFSKRPLSKFRMDLAKDLRLL